MFDGAERRIAHPGGSDLLRSETGVARQMKRPDSGFVRLVA